MSPEAILGGATNIRGGPPMKVGRPSDVWSLGCILYQMVRLPEAANERPKAGIMRCVDTVKTASLTDGWEALLSFESWTLT